MSDSITWRRFCRIPIDGKVPHPTTLMKLTARCGAAAVDGLNEALLAKAAQAKLLRTSRLRADTTVVPANVSYPTDSGLLARAVRRIAATGRRIEVAGGATRTQVRDRSRSAGGRAHAIAARLRTRSAQGRDEAQAAVRRVTGELASLAGRAAADAERMLANARRALRRAQARTVSSKKPDPPFGAAGCLPAISMQTSPIRMFWTALHVPAGARGMSAAELALRAGMIAAQIECIEEGGTESAIALLRRPRAAAGAGPRPPARLGRGGNGGAGDDGTTSETPNSRPTSVRSLCLPIRRICSAPRRRAASTAHSRPPPPSPSAAASGAARSTTPTRTTPPGTARQPSRALRA